MHVDFFKKRLWRKWFPMNFVTFIRTSCFIEHLMWLLQEGGDEASPAFFSKLKKVPWFWKKKGPHFVHLWVKFSTQGVILRLFSRKNSQIFLWEVFSLVYFSKTFIKAPWFHEPSPTHKNFLLCTRAWYVLILF